MKPISFYLSFILLLVLMGCRNNVPEDVISPSKMENVLYDYHLAQAMSQISDSTDYDAQLYSNAVFKKFSITQHEFDKSMEYYSRHADELYKIYQNLNERFSSTNGRSHTLGKQPVAGSDTIVIWSGKAFNILSANAKNYLDFEIPVDSSIHTGAQLIMHFNTQWIYHEGEKSAILNLTVHYANDSTSVLTRNLYDSGDQTLSLWVGKDRIRSISGFIYQVANWADRPKLLVISLPMFLCVNPKTKPKVETDNQISQNDSLQEHQKANPEHQLQDSLLNADNEKAHQNHFQ